MLTCRRSVSWLRTCSKSRSACCQCTVGRHCSSLCRLRLCTRLCGICWRCHAFMCGPRRSLLHSSSYVHHDVRSSACCIRRNMAALLQPLHPLPQPNRPACNAASSSTANICNTVPALSCACAMYTRPSRCRSQALFSRHGDEGVASTGANRHPHGTVREAARSYRSDTTTRRYLHDGSHL